VIAFNEIVVMDAKPTPKAAKHVAECVAKNECVCGCGKPILKRGLAANCYYAWRQGRAKQATKKDKAVYDAKLIRMGRLLCEQAIRSLKRKTVFDRVAEESAS
jgi:hypothetical protein